MGMDKRASRMAEFRLYEELNDFLPAARRKVGPDERLHPNPGPFPFPYPTRTRIKMELDERFPSYA